ncbi:hypothetical protein OAY15_00920 [Candidatus Pelagibacter sp.]|nr:hypothetical protein [Candidatus Pelagibacter sp.]
MLKIVLIIIYLLFSSSIVKSDSKINITVKESTDFTGKEFKRNEEGCGLQKNQKGNRDKESVLNIFYSKNSTIKGGTFECSLQNVIYAKWNLNLIISSVNASRGSDNTFEIRNSNAIIKDSKFSFSPQNKCVEGENGLLVFYNNILENCEQGFDIEKTDSSEFTAVVFLNNEFISIGHDAFNCHDKNDKKANKVYLFLKDNKFKKKGKDFRKFGKYSNCKKRFKISSELENAVLNSDFERIEILVRETIKNKS